MTIIDYVFIFLLFVVQPVYGYFSYKKYLRQIANGAASNRVKLYREVMILEWVSLAVLATAWITLARPIAELGFVSSSSLQILIGGGVTALATAYLLVGWHLSGKMSDAEKTKQIDALGDLIHFLPQDKRDFRHFVAVSFTAGIVEEIIYRAYAFWFPGALHADVGRSRRIVCRIRTRS